MSILAIGQSSFIAREVKKQDKSNAWSFLSHLDSVDNNQWPDDISAVVNFACPPEVRAGEFSDFDRNLAQKAQERGVPYVMLSSRTVYGVAEEPMLFVENQEPQTLMTPYGAAKKRIEDDLRDRFDHVTILRASNIFGFEYSQQQPRKTFFGQMLRNLKEQGEINFNMSPMTRRDFIPVEIFAQNLMVIAKAPKAGIYNLGSGLGASAGDIASWVMEGFGNGALLSSDQGIIDSFTLDMTKTRTDYGLEMLAVEDIKRFCVGVGRELQKVN